MFEDSAAAFSYIRQSLGMGRSEVAFLEDGGKWAAYPHHWNYKGYLPIIKKNSKDPAGALTFILWCFSEEGWLLTQL